MMTYQEARAVLEGRKGCNYARALKKPNPARESVKVANNTYLERLDPRTIGLRLHSTYVVKWTAHWVELNSGGWLTTTTRDRMEYGPCRISSTKLGWFVIPNRPHDCYCVGASVRDPEHYRPGASNWGSGWTPCLACEGTGRSSGPDYESGGHPYFDGMRLKPDGSGLLTKQPNAPKGIQGIRHTFSGFNGMTRYESQSVRNRQFQAMREGDWDTFADAREALSGHAHMAPTNVEHFPGGGTAVVYTMSQEAIRQCPFYIIDPTHYRTDGSCRCDDRTHTEMLDWGYRWNGERWEGDNV